jgi:hypothetical protein
MFEKTGTINVERNAPWSLNGISIRNLEVEASSASVLSLFSSHSASLSYKTN